MPLVTQCPECGRRWRGKRECHCARCHNHFGSPTSFDRHMVSGRCLDPSEMIQPATVGGAPRLAPSSNKYGTVWIERPRKETP